MNALALAAVLPPALAAQGFGGLPPHGALVHLKAGVCNQRVSVSFRGSAGLLFLRDGPKGSGFSWLTSRPFGFDNGKISAGDFAEAFSTQTGKHYTLTFASSDCPEGQGYAAAAATVSVSVT